MCGIFALINNTHNDGDITTAFNKGKHRGHESSSIIKAQTALDGGIRITCP